MLGACGYHVAGKGDLLPKTLHTVAIPAFSNSTYRYKLTDQMPEAIAKEFISRTRYTVVSDPSTADMILSGTILSYQFNPTIFDQTTQRANVADLRVTMQVTLTERATGKVLYQQPRFEVKESYQLSPVAVQYYEESEDALRRASTRVAQRIVSAILENF
jgi:outer membrane lipopolysaccharide assembly protein LptE/RlpB